ncbi:MAG: nucleotide pyrophosphohydrolase [Candidatus Roizmanbacteria bacterium]
MNRNFAGIIKQIDVFCDDRDWRQFHNPKDLAEAVVIEAGELLEQFLWKTKKQSEDHMKNVEGRAEVESEVADIFIYLFEFCRLNDVDVEAVVTKKLLEAGKKYPVEKAKGSIKKYTKLK